MRMNNTSTHTHCRFFNYYSYAIVYRQTVWKKLLVPYLQHGNLNFNFYQISGHLLYLNVCYINKSFYDAHMYSISKKSSKALHNFNSLRQYPSVYFFWHAKTVVESGQKYRRTFLINLIWSVIEFTNSDRRTAPNNSKRGKDILLIGTTFVWETLILNITTWRIFNPPMNCNIINIIVFWDTQYHNLENT